MCLITPQKQPIILDSDKIVYKLLNIDVSAIYYSFNYTFNLLYTTIIANADNGDTMFCADEIEKRYLDKNYPKWNIKNLSLNCIGAGFHAYIDFERAKKGIFMPDQFIYRCTFPAGSKYYESPAGACVSNQIIINKRVS